jgi:hypothetical protein
MSKSISTRYCTAALSLAVLLTAAYANADTPVASPPSMPLSSSFDGPCWAVVAPVGGTASGSNAHLFLNVPGGSNHDPLHSSNQAVRVVQPIGNVNFDVSIKIDSPLTATDANTSRGVMVVGDTKNFLTFELATDGTNIDLRAEVVTGGITTEVLNDVGFDKGQGSIFLRLTRTGSAYVGFYSLDGQAWTQATSFVDAKVPTSIGPFAGNYNSVPADAVPVAMSVNWFKAQ